MRSSNSVYQPTTTGIGEQNKTWSSGPTRFLGPGGTTTGGHGWPKSMVLLLAGLLAAMGLVMVIVGGRWHHDLSVAATAHAASLDQLNGGNSPANDTGGGGGGSVKEAGGGPAPPSATPYITILVVGLLLMGVAFVGLLTYYRSLGIGLPCCPGKIAHIRQRLHAQNKFPSGAPICAQYCPPGTASSPSSLSPSSPPPCSATTTLQPMGGSRGPVPTHHEPPFADVSEQQRLMGEDTDRMLEDDPRIVLSPLKTHEDC